MNDETCAETSPDAQLPPFNQQRRTSVDALFEPFTSGSDGNRTSYKV
jgi:hypothetical protein